MCYNASYDTERAFKKAIRDEVDPDVRADLERKYQQWKEKNPDIYRERRESINQGRRYFTSAFEHDAFPVVFTEHGKKSFDFLQWGLVPRWCKLEEKALQLWNQCINARSETLFEKPSFKASALDRRCVVYMSGFFEYHHQGKTKIPFFIQDKHSDVMLVGGIWDEALIEGKTWRTFSIVTVPASENMALIHNNPKNPNRMPLILTSAQVDLWINPTNAQDKPTLDAVKDIIRPYPSDGLSYKTVPPLLGKAGVGDAPMAQERFDYIDLDIELN